MFDDHQKKMTMVRGVLEQTAKTCPVVFSPELVKFNLGSKQNELKRRRKKESKADTLEGSHRFETEGKNNRARSEVQWRLEPQRWCERMNVTKICTVLWGPKGTTKVEINSQRPIKTPIEKQPSVKSVLRWRLLDKILTEVRKAVTQWLRFREAKRYLQTLPWLLEYELDLQFARGKSLWNWRVSKPDLQWNIEGRIELMGNC